MTGAPTRMPYGAAASQARSSSLANAVWRLPSQDGLRGPRIGEGP